MTTPNPIPSATTPPKRPTGPWNVEAPRPTTSPTRTPYPTDVTDWCWQVWELLLPPVQIPENFPEAIYERREILNAILYRKKTGCQWRCLPHDFPNWSIVYYHFQEWRKKDVFERANASFRRLERSLSRKPLPKSTQESIPEIPVVSSDPSAPPSIESPTSSAPPSIESPPPIPVSSIPAPVPPQALRNQENLSETLAQPVSVEARVKEYRNPEPSLGVVDSQSVKGTPLSVNGCDGGKLVIGRKRHILVDVLGILLAVIITTASVQDREGFLLLTKDLKKRFPRMVKILVDGVYTGDKIENFEKETGIIVEVRKKGLDTDGKPIKGFQPIPQRWVVERSFGWLGWDRILSKCYERLPESEASWIYLSSASRLTRRLERRLSR